MRDERARPHPGSRAHRLPVLRRRLRRAGAAGRPRAARSSPAIPIIRRISAGCAPRASRSARRWASRPAAASDAAAGRRHATRASIGTPRSAWSPTASSASPSSTGRAAIAFYLSGQLLTEDYYVANKLMKGFLGSANVDTNSRLCMASSVAGHRRAFGADIVPGNYEDLDQADLIVLVGSNAAWCHPVLFQRMIAQPARARRQDRRDRSAPHRDRRRRRSVSADRAGHRHGAVLRPAGASGRHRRARSTLSSKRTPPALPRRSRARARSRPTSRRPPPRPASTRPMSRASSSCSREAAQPSPAIRRA